MKEKMVNESRVAGYLYDHKLERKVTGSKSKNPGTEYLRGTISIATDDSCMNVVKVAFVYVVSTYKDKKGAEHPNQTFGYLGDIIDGKIKTVVNDGKENAAIVICNGNLNLVDYPSRQNPDEMISFLQNESRFINFASQTFQDFGADFRTDMLITNVKHNEADEEKNIKEHVVVKGCIFDWQVNPLPVSFKVYHPGAIEYFEDLELPCFTQVRGKQVSSTQRIEHKEANAWGEEEITYSTRSVRDFVITGAKPEPYGIDEESTGKNLTFKEIKELQARRERRLAEIKQTYEEYQNAATESNDTPEFQF